MQCLSSEEPLYGQQKWKAYFPLIFQEVLDQAESYRQTEAYLKAMRKRSVWVEPLFGEAKEFHRLRRFRLRRLLKVNIEGVMVAAGQNLKRLIKHHLEFSFSQIHLFVSKFPSYADFFNSLQHCANNIPSLPLLLVIHTS